MSQEREEKLADALRAARDKLKIYRSHMPSQEYFGGMEYSALMRLIDDALGAR